ncbi:MAG: hypothetical protein CL578_22415 [Alteromonadaceae bacterium]|jgi:hypothetical protein|uniref:hypothetical protein n=1 Tax=unclassified Methylophaga TaxID=2629249 RepID=UPI000C43A8CD|nr:MULTISPECIES: hypothetical protein [unclassified Methylophaga]MBN27782.1 hypothetical protein [Alteromonadaceae bacterium]MAP27784.1 hypothetical protein [Methylophaga sp.]HAD31530.1 hypothetical protein [Methylophaga sp.]HBX59825.1 hypothetical protein [Methylophaga sp.]HCN99402.1 hypothetical protein [Methylophaga sp.]|tara:strand:- start:23747 stop:24043 length:297 start_codon:yes stop_codon:yes gene_type:complete
MASNKELTAKIKSIKPDAVTDNLKNAELAALLKSLSVDAEKKVTGVQAYINQKELSDKPLEKNKDGLIPGYAVDEKSYLSLKNKYRAEKNLLIREGNK